MSRASVHCFLFSVLFLAAPAAMQAARVSDVTETTTAEQFVRFLTMRDPSLRFALLGAVLLGISCGLLGGFIVVRKMALMGDALSHAVLPGVVAGFLWNMEKDPVAILVGATIAGLLGSAMVTALTRTTRIKEDAALGLVLASFFALGLCLQTMIVQNLPTGNQSGLDKFMFGQAAALSGEDVSLMGIVTALAVGLVGLFYKELLVTSFDEGFARASGLPVRWVHHGLMLLLAMSVVIALKAVGVVLVSAMLITPAAAAYLLTDRLHRLLGLAVLFGVLAAVAGAFFSFVGKNLPTGPLMVLGASSVFLAAFLFGPRHGVIAKWWGRRSHADRTQRENTLKAIYHVWESEGVRAEGVALTALAEKRRATLEELRREVDALERHGLATVAGPMVYFTPAGRQRGAEIVRNHRLWELYLTNSANIAADHVHDDAENIEHVLGEDVVRELERRLGYATRDPHGKAIPSAQDIHQGGGLSGEAAKERPWMNGLIPHFDFEAVFVLPWTEILPNTASWMLMGFFVTAACGLVGNYLMLRRMALMGDAVSHSVLPGLVIAFLLTGSRGTGAMFLGALLAGVVTTVIIETIHRKTRVKQDASIGVTFTTLFAIGVVLVSIYSSQVDLDAECVLYGEIGFIPAITGWSELPEPLVRMGCVLVVVAGLIGFFYKELLVSSFDAGLARSLGINTTFVHYAMMTMLSIVVVSAFEAVGSILVVAMLILPGATAGMLSTRLPVVHGLSVVHAALSSVLGVHLALALGCQIGPAMVVAGAGLFALAWVFSPTQGLLRRWRKPVVLTAPASE